MLEIDTWERGLRFTAGSDPGMFVYLYFYEWNMFEAVREGEHTGGRFDYQWQVTHGGAAAEMQTDPFHVRADVQGDRVNLSLRVTNQSQRNWPDPAAMIPCFNPGDNRSVPRNEGLADEAHERTWFVGGDGLDRLHQREIHFNRSLRDDVDRRATDGRYVFSDKWPTSDRDAAFGALIRESNDGRWVAGIAWDDFLSAQGHNPRFCMHLSVRVGPLAPGETVERQGRIYLFEGDATDCLDRAKEDLAWTSPTH